MYSLAHIFIISLSSGISDLSIRCFARTVEVLELVALSKPFDNYY